MATRMTTCQCLTQRRFVRFALVLGSSLAIQVAGPALSQVERSGGGGVSQQLYQDYQQAVSERTQLRADNAKLKSDLAAAQKQLAAVKQQLASARSGTANDQAALAAAQAEQAATAKNLATLKGQADELIARFRETISQLQGVETDRTLLRQQLAQSKATFDQCAVANDQLYQVDDEVLNRYMHQGAFSYLARAEPFTRIERTRIDNLVLQYRQRAEALRVQGAAPATGSAAAAATGAPPVRPGATPAAQH